MTIASLLFAGMFAAQAAAADWHVVTASKSDSDFTLQWIDKSSITASGGHAHAWAYFVSRAEAIHATVEFDCDRHRVQIDQITIEKPDGSTQPVPGASGWEPLSEEEPLNTVMAYVCSGGTTKTALAMSTGTASPVPLSRRVLEDMARQNKQ
ncbi:MAG: hypothetical protein ACOY45_11045 [Pseudomonadota bacterium]